MSIRVNMQTKVNSKSIRREVVNGRDHYVIPSYTLPSNVIMNGGLYPADQIDKHYESLNNTLAPLGHPQVDGEYVSAFSPEGINAHHVGAWNKNARREGNRVYIEKFLDIEFAKNSEGGRRLLERLEAIMSGEETAPIHTSTGLLLNKLEPTPQQRAMGAEWVANIVQFDHDAILLDEVGAATPEQGVGMMVNTDQAVELKANEGALVGETFRDRERRLERAARELFRDSEYVWVIDFTDTQAVISRDGGIAEIYSYTVDGDRIVLGASGDRVERQESWVRIAANKLKSVLTPQARPEINQTEADMALTPEEKTELLKEVGTMVAEAVKPLADSVQEIAANQKAVADQLQANKSAAEADMRKAVAAKFGEVVANSVTGDALAELHKQCGTVAPVGTPAVNSAHAESLVSDNFDHLEIK